MVEEMWYFSYACRLANQPLSPRHPPPPSSLLILPPRFSLLIHLQYKPVFKELTVWPELNLANPPGVSPFADPKVNKTVKNTKVSSSHKDDHKERQRVKEKNVGAKAKDGGYCELCSTNFTNLKLHLQSDSHISFIKNDKNYQKLDELINGSHRTSSQ
ncbi:hypothetical protein SK128_026649, partial [Halocaridina rubra]